VPCPSLRCAASCAGLWARTRWASGQWEMVADHGVVKAVSIVSTPALNIFEYFGTESSGDTRLSACVASATERCGQAFQEPEFDEYVLVTSGRVELVRGGNERTIVSQGEGVLLKAGERVTWTWPEACQYVIICLPSLAPEDGIEDLAAETPEAQPQAYEPTVVAAEEVAAQASPEPRPADGACNLQADSEEDPEPAGDWPSPEQAPSGERSLPDGARSAGARDADAEEMHAKQVYLKKVQDIFAELEQDGNQEVSLTQFKRAMKARGGSGGSSSGSSSSPSIVGECLEPSQVEILEATTTYTVSSNGTSTSNPCQNLPEYISSSSGSGEAGALMGRATSLSAFEQLLDNDGLLVLRSRLEQEERTVRYGAKHLSTPIVIVSSEIHPWSKTGGLAMVTGSFAYEFAMRGHRTMAVSPYYSRFEGCKMVGRAKVWLDGQEHEVRYYHQRQEYGAGKGCDYVFVDHHSYHRTEGLYGDPKRGGEYEDNLFRFSLLSIAALEAPLVLELAGSTYGQDVCFIANDWQTGLLPVYLLHKYKRSNVYRNARCLMVLHNMGYQGKYRKSRYPCDRFLGLPLEAERVLQGEDINYRSDCINLLGAGIQLADRVLTVSPNYALEMQTPDGGHGLHRILREKAGRRRLVGILNGISDEWNPATDPHIPANYSVADFIIAKRKCKAALQKELGLIPDPDVALLGFCGRLCYQKGVHLITEIIPWLMTDTGNGVNGRVQILLMGKGDSNSEDQLRSAEGCYRGRVCSFVGFKAELEHKMMAACDLLLMPSQYEPCGLPQMYAQQYATLPVVHETGGLKDSVRGLFDEAHSAKSATGFLFSGFNSNKFMERLYQALDIFHNKKALFKQLQENAIKSDYYWPHAMDEYERQIDLTLEEPPTCG